MKRAVRSRAAAAFGAALVLAACDRAPEPGPYTLTLDLAPVFADLAKDEAYDHEAAVERLAAVGPDVVPLLETATHDPRPGVADGAVEALGAIDDPRAATALARIAAGDGAPALRAAALVSLVQGHEGDRVRAALETALADPEPVVHLTAAGLCGALCTSPAALDRLVALALAEGAAPGEALRAQTSVGQLLAASDGDTAKRTRDLVLARVVPRFAGTTGSEHAVVGLLALTVGVDGSAAAVVDATTNEPDVSIRAAAIRALGTYGGTDALPALGRALDDPAMAAVAVDAVRRLAARGVSGAAPLLAARAGRTHADAPEPGS